MNASFGGNAIATAQDRNKIIAFDRELSPKVGHRGAMMIHGHKLGHQFCHHLGTSADPRKELVADRFAGVSMRLNRMTLQDALSAVPILDERPSKTHPGRADRSKLSRQAGTIRFPERMLISAGESRRAGVRCPGADLAQRSQSCLSFNPGAPRSQLTGENLERALTNGHAISARADGDSLRRAIPSTLNSGHRGNSKVREFIVQVENFR